jgi:glycosyltransferase involved in cell wall biosynthesis
MTDTFGLVLLEALACGVPVAAFPVAGPRDVIGDAPVAVLGADLRSACLQALTLSREACRSFALARGWDASARTFLNNVLAANRMTATEAAAGRRAARERSADGLPARGRAS